MAYAVCVVLGFDPQVRNVRGNLVTYRRNAFEDVAFFLGRAQLRVTQWSRADRVEVRIRGSKGDQLRK